MLCLSKNIRLLAKLGKKLKVANTRDECKAESETSSAVSVAFRENPEAFDMADNMLVEHTLTRDGPVVAFVFLRQRMFLAALLWQ